METSAGSSRIAPVSAVLALVTVGSTALLPADPVTAQLREIPAAAYEGDEVYPFETVSPQQAGLDAERLEAAADLAREGGSDSLLVLRDGRLVVERYWNGKTADDLQQTYSATKPAFALLVGRLLQEGTLDSLDQSLADFVQPLRVRGLGQLTFRNVMAMESGLEHSAELDRREQQAELSQIEAVIGRQIAHPPFEHYHYNNAAYRALFYAVEEATRSSLLLLTHEELFEPLGMKGARWMVWRKGDVSYGYQSIRMRPRDLAKVGLVMLGGGVLAGERFVPESYVEQLITPPAPDVNPSYGLFWHLNGGEFFLGYRDSDRIDGPLLPGTPGDAYAAYGSGGQVLVCIPSLDLLWVRTGETIPSTLWERPSWVAELSAAIVDAVAD